jgi:hypothetical protein
MAWMSCMGPCGACGTVFSFNPDRVPSFRFKVEKEPVCSNCMAAINAKREANGLKPFTILAGAYEAEEVF